MKKQFNLLREFSIPLILGVLSALVWANVNFDSYQAFLEKPFVGNLSFHFISNELFMVFFFGIAAVEITHSVLPGGDMHPLKRAVNPLFATFGGVAGPVAAYFLLNAVWGTPELSRGWGIPTATDIALAWLAARIAFGAAHPAVNYLLLLAVADDAIGLLIIAVFYPNPNLPVAPEWLVLTAVGIGAAWLLRSRGVRNYWPYIIIGGTLSWFGLHHAHLHPALALVGIVPFLPHGKHPSKQLFEENRRDASTLSRFEHEWKVIVDFGLFMFGLANAGVPFSGVQTVTWLVLAALIAGKGAGILLFGWFGKRLGFALPKGMTERDLLILGIVAGIGFTVALFVAGEAFTDPMTRGAAKMGAILSIVAFPLAIVLARLPGRGTRKG